MTVLKIDSSARVEGANSRIVTDYLVQQLGQPVIERDLVKSPLPPMSPQDLVGVHGSHKADRASLQQHLAMSNKLIAELQQADTLVLGVAMYNFSVPLYLKQWIDYVCRAGVSFRYTENGPEGLTGVKRAFIVTASGGTPIGGDWDFASRYMEHICRFLGINEVVHIDASGSKGSPEVVIAAARQQIDAMLAQPEVEEA
ncbi:FMN-dependent NADH-azoreductase [Congregibacter litoralis]|uniref:FMN dependent NADH:quinone oxidoreductase n=1 Tax=Congregibacter litoralis KT71 TaxID=314285 RepID=A4A492_9GAMM|nr:NAD(P)H-dependent oxidoreductase [Congregibacter litoralis]EAQ99515.1 Acyl carrier protein phosphodiesterase [Congregibacter litoralis KT71]